MAINARERRCKARTKAGKPCEAAPMAGGMCFFHGNPNKAVELGRKGGRRKHLSSSENPDPLPKLNTVLDVHDVAARLVTGVLTGQVDPRVAVALAPVLNVQLRAMAMKFDELLAELEKPGADKEPGGACEESLKLPDRPPATHVAVATGDASDQNEMDTFELRAEPRRPNES